MAQPCQAEIKLWPANQMCHTKLKNKSENSSVIKHLIALDCVVLHNYNIQNMNQVISKTLTNCTLSTFYENIPTTF